MRIVLASYLHVGLVKGGMYRQVCQTRDALVSLGHDLSLYSPWDGVLENADVLHVFGSFDQMLPLMRAARRLSKPVVWSTVMSLGGQPAWKFHLMSWFGRHSGVVWVHWRDISEMASLADAIIALGASEDRLLRQIIPESVGKTRIIPNGVDRRFAQGTPDEFCQKFGLKPGYVLHVGYFATEKNQIRLIEAQRQFRRPLVLIGGPGQGGPAYYEQCKALASLQSDVVFAGTFPAGSPLLASAYAGARVFCLPSLFEVQPLTIMEAALAGCSLVGSASFPVMECLAGQVAQPDPRSPAAIANAIMRAYTIPSRAQAIMLAQPDWTDVAQQLVRCYEEVWP